MKSFFYFPVSLLCFHITVHAQDTLDLCNGFVMNYHSRILNEERQIFMSIPDSAEMKSNGKYPLIFLIEAEHVFYPFTSIVRTMEKFNEIPPCIVVGLPLNNRHIEFAPVLKDYPESGNAANMLAFISQEIFPYLDSLYGLDYDKTVLWGHSAMAGLFSTTTFLGQDTTFNGFILSSPNLRFAEEYINQEDRFRYVRQRDAVTLYVTFGSQEDEIYHASITGFVELIKREPIDGLRWKFKINEDRNHHTSAYASLIDGLKFYFEEPKK